MGNPIPRDLLDAVDADALRSLLSADPDRATVELGPWCDHPLGAQPLNYVAMLRFDTHRGLWRDGHDGESETPLMTTASYGDAEVAQALVEAGADLERTASPDAGGIPEGTALRHAVVFGMTPVVDVLIAAGAEIGGLGDAAAAGDLSGWLTVDTPLDDRVRALILAAVHERTAVIDALLGPERRSMPSIPCGPVTRCATQLPAARSKAFGR